MKQISIYNKFFFVTLLCFSSITYVQAQTEPMYSQYMFNMMGVNPAYAGNREALSMNLFQRNQWVGIKGAPVTTSISMDKAFRNNTMGMGLQLYNDHIGVESATGFNYMLSSKIRVSEEGVLSGGLSVGLMNYKINLNDVDNRYTPTDPSFISMDNPSQWMPTVGFGIYYNTEKFFIGASTPSVLKSRLAQYANMNSSIQNRDDFHFFLSSGMVVDINDQVKLKPSTLVKMVSGAPIELDMNVNVWLHDLIGVGGSYRTGDSYVSMLEVQSTENLRFGYAYDVPFSPLKYFTKGSHEIMLRYEFGNTRSKVKSTRYF